MTLYDNGRLYIEIDTKLGNKTNTGKGRFALAHELDNYYIDHHRIGLQQELLKPRTSLANFIILF